MNEGAADERDSWQGGFRQYAGWVPNVRSHLSFSMIAAARGALTWTQPLRGSAARVVLVYQHRIVNDYPLAEWLAKWIAPDISLHWLMVARTGATEIPITIDDEPLPQRDRQGMLRGTIQLMPYIEDSKLRATQEAAIAQLATLLRSEPCPSNAAIETLRGQAVGIVERGTPTITLDFALMRTGECRVWYAQQPDDVDEADLDWVAEQGYYFIKDIVHEHTHHDAASDQITPLYPFGRGSAEEGHDDEIAWRRETLWSISREIERLNREGGLTDQRKSLGIIAYAEAFQQSLMGHTRTGDPTQPFGKSTLVHHYDFKHLKDSIKASIDVASTKLTQKIQVAIAALSVFLATTSLVSSLVSAHNGAGPKNQVTGAPATPITLGGLDNWVPMLASDPAYTGFVMMVCLLGLIAYFLLDGRAGIYNRAQRWLSQLGRAISVTLFDSLLKQWLFVLAWHLMITGLVLWTMLLCFAIIMKGITE
jgi:hypothetical protein